MGLNINACFTKYNVILLSSQFLDCSVFSLFDLNTSWCTLYLVPRSVPKSDEKEGYRNQILFKINYEKETAVEDAKKQISDKVLEQYADMMNKVYQHAV